MSTPSARRVHRTDNEFQNTRLLLGGGGRQDIKVGGDGSELLCRGKSR